MGARAIWHAAAMVAAALFSVPLVMLVAGSLRGPGVAPAYWELARLLPLGTYLWNSAAVAAVAVPITVVVASWAGFGISLLSPRARRRAVGACLAVLLIPVTAVWATRFQVYRWGGIIGGLMPLVAPALLATSPFLVLVYAWAFGRLPHSQFEAARLEGASAWQIWRRVAMPQARTATLAVGVLAFTFHWGNLTDALLYVRGQEAFTLPLGLQTLFLLHGGDTPVLLAGAVVVALPAVAVFLVAQRKVL